jgi:hypothetical protein
VSIRRADTEAKWPRINQRRPIINELRPQPPRVCIKTRLFVTHLSRDRARPAFVITLRRQTVSIRRHGDQGGSKVQVRPAVSSREQSGADSPRESVSPPFPPLGSFTLSCALPLRLVVWVFLRYGSYQCPSR